MSTDDLRVWGGREPYDPGREDAQALTLSAIEHFLGDDTQGITDCLERLAGKSGRALFAAAWGWARIASRTAAEGVEGDGRYYVEVEEFGEDRETPDGARNIAAFLAASANDDCEGACRMWVDLGPIDAIPLAFGMLEMVTAAIRFTAERDGDQP